MKFKTQLVVVIFLTVSSSGSVASCEARQHTVVEDGVVAGEAIFHLLVSLCQTANASRHALRHITPEVNYAATQLQPVCVAEVRAWRSKYPKVARVKWEAAGGLFPAVLCHHFPEGNTGIEDWQGVCR